MSTPAMTAENFVIPPLIKRNTILFALAQSFSGAGMQFAYGLGPLMVLALTGSAALAGLSVGLVGLSRFLASYPVGKITDTYGRKPGVVFGLSLAMLGGVICGTSMYFASIWVYIIGMTVFGMGMSGVQQLRVAATDMYPHFHRAQALGYLAMGSLIGLLFSPLIVAGTEKYALANGYEPLALPWFCLPILIVTGMGFVYFVRPDPKEIGMNLSHYYPGYVPPPRPKGSNDKHFSARELLKNVHIRQAIVANTAGQGNMSIVMVLTSLVLAHHGSSLASIAFSHVFHSAGMFAFTIPLGKLADRFGREKVMYPGVFVSLVGAALVAFTDGSYWLVTLGTFLVGLGWAAGNVAATAMIADHVEVHQRGRAIGVNESCAGAVNVLMALVTGPILQWWGLPMTGAVAVAVALPPLLLWAYYRVRPDPALMVNTPRPTLK
ncbi:MAG: MFS transporter [Burkholderiales bacterium]